MLHGEKNPNPNKRFLKYLATMIKTWRGNTVNYDILLMADMTEFIGDKHDLHNFCQKNNHIDPIFLLNSELKNDTTYLWDSKYIDCILIPHTLSELAVKSGYQHLNHHFISDHKGIYIQFKAADIFDTATMDRSHASYCWLRMSRRDIVGRYVSHLEALYKEHSIWKRAEKIARRVLTASSTPLQDFFNS